ncbi:phasin family protein [Sandaracinobacteroides hominis]|uniref:phasin family protein n=1 Tax=Sandaracinobacteroides hominis TaxID=2780086 RepID=UPI0018F30A85|nr:phasin family protein [Sandaracinobacteroides hominis]
MTVETGAEARPVAASKPVARPVKPIGETPMTTETITKTLETVVPAMEKATTDAVAQAQAGFEQMNGKVREMMEKNMKSITEMNEFAKGNVEALIESAKAAAAGAETLTTHFVESSKASFEESQAAFKSMTALKSPAEVLAAQQQFAKTQFDKAVANWSHVTETWMKLAGEVVQPLSNRVALAQETVKKSMAV